MGVFSVARRAAVLYTHLLYRRHLYGMFSLVTHRVSFSSGGKE